MRSNIRKFSRLLLIIFSESERLTVQRIMKTGMPHLLLCFLLLSFLAKAQPPQELEPLDAPKAEALNNYVRFANELLHAAALLQEDFENFNRQINNYYASDRHYSFQLRMVRVIDKKNKGREQSVWEAWVIAKTIGTQRFDYGQRVELTEAAEKLYDILENLQKMQHDLCDYALSSRIESDRLLDYPYAQLHAAASLYRDLKVARDDLARELDILYKSYRYPQPNTIQIRSHILMRELHAKADELLKALRAQDQDKLRELLKEYRLIIAKMEDFQARYLYDLTCKEDLEKEKPCHRKLFDSLTYAATDFLSYTSEYLHNEDIPKYYKDLGKEYYYYNSRYTNAEMRYGRGFLEMSNTFIGLADIPLLHLIQEPKLFKAWDIRKFEDLEEEEDVPQTAMTERGPLAGAPPVNLILLLDVSRSMTADDKLPRLKEAFIDLLGQMRSVDRVAIISFSGEAELLLSATPARRHGPILRAINQLKTQYSTDADAGIGLAVTEAVRGDLHDSNNRIVMATDGMFKVDNRTKRRLERYSEKYNFSLSVFDFNSYPKESIEDRLRELARLGKGNYRYMIDNDVRSILLDEMQGH